MSTEGDLCCWMKLTLSWAGHTCRASLASLWSGLRTIIMWGGEIRLTWSADIKSSESPNISHSLGYFCWSLRDSPPSSVCIQCMLWYTDNNLRCYDIHSQNHYFSLPWRLMRFPVTGANTVPNSCAVVQNVGEGCGDWTDRCASAIWTCSS